MPLNSMQPVVQYMQLLSKQVAELFDCYNPLIGMPKQVLRELLSGELKKVQELSFEHGDGQQKETKVSRDICIREIIEEEKAIANDQRQREALQRLMDITAFGTKRLQLSNCNKQKHDEMENVGSNKIKEEETCNEITCLFRTLVTKSFF